jgi:hypothetical protein
LLLLAACAPTLTPAQEWVMTNFEQCRVETGGWNARLDRVEPGGSYYVTMAQTQSDYNRVKACLDERWRVSPPPRPSSGAQKSSRNAAQGR